MLFCFYQDGLLASFAFDVVHSSELVSAREVMIFGGGGVVSVVRVNGTTVGGINSNDHAQESDAATPGPVFRVLREMLAAGGFSARVAGTTEVIVRWPSLGWSAWCRGECAPLGYPRERVSTRRRICSSPCFLVVIMKTAQR